MRLISSSFGVHPCDVKHSPSLCTYTHTCTPLSIQGTSASACAAFHTFHFIQAFALFESLMQRDE